ncbi:MAG: hypothetical protein Q4D57_06665 [Clostridia bacterium]|nr:hypothetical protein [Clostridia bacterium]
MRKMHKGFCICRATDREVIDYIGSIFLAPLDNGKEMGGKITE